MDSRAQSLLVRQNFKQELVSRLSYYTLIRVLNQDYSKGELCALLYKVHVDVPTLEEVAGNDLFAIGLQHYMENIQ